MPSSPARSFFRPVASIAGGAALGQVVMFAVSPIATRLYDPAAFGELSVYLAIVGVVGGVACLRYDLAIPLAREELDAAAILALSLLTALATAGISGLCLWALAAVDVVPLPVRTLWLVPPGVLLFGGYTAFRSWQIRANLFRALGRGEALRGGVNGASLLGLGLVWSESLSLMAANLAGTLAGLLATRPVGPAWRHVREAACWSRTRDAVGVHWRFPVISVPSGLVNAAGQLIPSALAATLYGKEVGGFLLMAQRVGMLPIFVVGRAVGDVYLGRLRNALHQAPVDSPGLFVATTGRLLLVGAGGLAFTLLAGAVFPFVFGQRWAEAGVYLIVLSVGLVAQMVASPLAATLNLIHRQEVHFAWDVVRLGMVLGVLVVPRYLGLDARVAVMAYSAGSLACYGVLPFIVLHLLRRHVDRAEDPPDAASDRPAL